MGVLKNLVQGMGEDKKEIKSKLKDAEQNRKVQEIIVERSKSANRREFEKYLHEQDEDKITEALKKIRKERGKALWKGDHSVLTSEYDILKTDRPILKEKNIFKPSKKIKHKGGGWLK